MCRHRGPLRAPTPAPGLNPRPSSGEEAEPLPRNVPTPEVLEIHKAPFYRGLGRTGVLQTDSFLCPKAEASQDEHPEWVISLS